MTLVLTVSRRADILVATDMRFTSGVVPTSFEEYEPKLVVVQGSYLRCVVSFAGLAAFGRHWTNDWLISVLSEGKAASLSPDDLIRLLASRADEQWGRLRREHPATPASAFHTTFAVTGWAERNGEPVHLHCLISNFEIQRPPFSSVGAFRVVGRIVFPQRAPSTWFAASLIGSGRSSELPHAYVRRLRKVSAASDSFGECGSLVRAIFRTEAQNPALRGTVGPNALVVQMPAPGWTIDAAAVFHEDGLTKYVGVPTLTEGAVITSVKAVAGALPAGVLAGDSVLAPVLDSFATRKH